jgi:hypothetical protein
VEKKVGNVRGDFSIERARDTRVPRDFEHPPARVPDDVQARLEIRVKAMDGVVVEALGTERLVRLAQRPSREKQEKREAHPEDSPSH